MGSDRCADGVGEGGAGPVEEIGQVGAVGSEVAARSALVEGGHECGSWGWQASLIL